MNGMRSLIGHWQVIDCVVDQFLMDSNYIAHSTASGNVYHTFKFQFCLLHREGGHVWMANGDRTLMTIGVSHSLYSLSEMYPCRSRVGKGDMGANAKRIEAFFEMLRAELAV